MTWAIAALAIDTGIPMSVLVEEPPDFLDAMFQVLDYRRDEMEDSRG